MEQLILHLIGDYVTQSDWMAQNKTKRTPPALAHAIARFVVFAKNCLLRPAAERWNDPLGWEDHSGTGYHKDAPAWLAVWLLIAADNTLHLAINYCSLRWL